MKPPLLFSWEEIEGATGAQWASRASSEGVTGVSIDSRTIRPGELFIAIRGKRLDGHEFIEAALAKGAPGALVEEWALPQGLSGPKFIGRVPDSLRALGDLARFHRNRFTLEVVGITGSNGKTTTKTMLQHLLSEGRAVLATPGSENNQIGVPLALLRLDLEHTIAVLELGTNRWGEIRSLADMAQPTLGVVTNIGPAHLETFGDLRGVLRAKGELWQIMAAEKPLVFCADDPLLKKAGRSMKRRILWFGTSPDADVRATQISLESWGSRCLVNGQWEMRLPLPGRHNLMNALAAVACASLLGEEIPSAVGRIETVPAVYGRLTRVEVEGCLVIHDAHNANPASLKAALEVLQGLDRTGRRIVMVGDMLELGDQAQLLHAQAGRWIAESGTDVLMGIGEWAGALLSAAQEAGLSEENCRAFQTVEEAGGFLVELLHPGDTVLLKASRGMQLERVLQCFTTSLPR